MARIVIVEDDGALRNDIAGKLTDWGHQVMQASNGHDGFAAIEEFQPDLVLSDINMPSGSGLDLVQRVTGLGSQYADMAFLFISSLDEPKEVVYGIHCGADDYITKPIHYDLLKIKVESHLRKNSKLVDKISTDRLALSMGAAMMSGAMFVASGAVLGFVCLIVLYWIKTVLGINVFQDVHFSDFF